MYRTLASQGVFDDNELYVILWFHKNPHYIDAIYSNVIIVAVVYVQNE